MAEKQAQPEANASRQGQVPVTSSASKGEGQGSSERGIQRQQEPSGAMGPWGRGGGSPYGLMRRMMSDMERMFEGFGFGGFGPFASESWPSPSFASSIESFVPAVEVLERDGNLLVRADLPGIKKEDLKVHVEEGSLVIEGERKSEHEEKREGYFQSERSYGSFHRRIALPRGIDTSTCDATFDDGVLEVKLVLPQETRKQVDVRSKSQAEPPKGTRH